MIRLLSMSGSLRALSSNTALLDAAAAIGAPGVSVQAWRGLDTLPHFNPERQDDPPPPVQALRDAVAQADGLLIACPNTRAAFRARSRTRSTGWWPARAFRGWRWRCSTRRRARPTRRRRCGWC